MREIKFRAYNKFIETFAYFEDGKYWYDTEQGHFDNGRNAFHWEKAEQYTGLKDKNGVEIYKGDILKMKYQDVNIGIVERVDNGFWICVDNRIIFPASKLCEVIGNIHENPELLEVS